MRTVIADTGPLVALFKKDDQWHSWAVATGNNLSGILHTCEAVLTEAFFLLARIPNGQAKLAEALRKPGLIALPWTLEKERRATLELMHKYEDVPASFADMCLVRMAELAKDPIIWTTDEHFSVYRIRGTKKIPIIAPE